MSPMHKPTNNRNKATGRSHITKNKAKMGAFDEIVRMIDAARERAWRAVNTELVSLYWEIGKWLSVRMAKAEWGDKTILELAAHIAKTGRT